jgi:hypothetical protein
VRQARASNFDLSVAHGLQCPDRTGDIIANKAGVGPDRLLCARDDPLVLFPPGSREGAFVRTPFSLVIVPIAHDLVHSAAIHTAHLLLSFLDEWRNSAGLGPNAIWSTLPSRDWFIPNTSFATPFPFSMRVFPGALCGGRCFCSPTELLGIS